MTAATERPSRIATLDIVRGVAVMGILAMNIVGFAMPEPAYFNPEAYGGAEGANLWAWTAAFILFDGKMRGLFSLLFGASMLLVIQAAARKGENPARVHYSRMAWLLLFGAAHFYLIWWGDILLHYALVGLIAYAFHDKSVRTLTIAAVILLAVDLLMLGSISMSFIAARDAAAAPGAHPAAVEAWRSMSAEFGPMTSEALAWDLSAYGSDYGAAVARHVAEDWWFPFFFLLIGGYETLALMLIGMIGLRTGFLTGAWAPAHYRRIALAGIGLGAAGSAALALALMGSGFDPALVYALGVAGTVVPRFLMIFGYAALVILATRGGGALVERIGAAGRAAFTNYLGTSLVMTGIFYGWGLGLCGRFERWQAYLFVLPMWALMLLWSKPWLDRHLYGPFEWLWRSLARGRVQPMRLPPAG